MSYNKTSYRNNDMDKREIIIFGTGNSASTVIKCLRSNNLIINGYLDNNRTKTGQLLRGVRIYHPDDVLDLQFDYIIIASVWFDKMLQQLLQSSVDEKTLIPFFDEKIHYETYQHIFDITEWKIEAFKQNMQVKTEKMVTSYLNNLPYEIADEIRKDNFKFPMIKSAEDGIIRLIEKRHSLCRFGDGEFEIMAGHTRARFQKPDSKLGKRLREILVNNEPGIVTAIAANYGSLSIYTREAATAIRSYMTPSVRAFHMKSISMEKIYYDAYMSRPYVLYQDKEKAAERFHLLKRIWEQRSVVVIEGENTRMGYQNDLLDNAAEIHRILCPCENAWNKYEDILHTAKKMPKDALLLIALGPTATVLAYDLAQESYQAVDIGHLDNEYDWFLKGEGKRFNIPCKYVSECENGTQVEPIHSDWYDSQIIERIV